MGGGSGAKPLKNLKGGYKSSFFTCQIHKVTNHVQQHVTKIPILRSILFAYSLGVKVWNRYRAADGCCRQFKTPHMLALFGIVLLSFFLNFYLIGQNGYGNAYYAAAIRSMTQSVKNFFFISFDPAGVVSVDKSPLGLWVQALFVLIFGYQGWAMLAATGTCGRAFHMHGVCADRSVFR